MEESFVFYTSWADAIEDFSPEVQLEVYKAVIRYARSGEESELSPMAKVAFRFIKADIDRSKAKYNNIIDKRKEAAKKRWEKNTTETDANADFAIQKNTNDANDANAQDAMQMDANDANADFAMHNDNDNDNDNDNVSTNVDKNKNKKTLSKESEEKEKEKKVFVPPKIEEVEEYIREKGYDIDAEIFVSFYESKGWMIGKNKMKSWRAAVLTWHKTRKEETHYATDNKQRSDRRGGFEIPDIERKVYHGTL